MLEKLSALEQKYTELTAMLGEPDIIADQPRYRKLTKAHADLSELVGKYREYQQAVQELQEAQKMLEEKLDPDFRELVASEVDALKERIVNLESVLRVLLLPKDPNDEKNVIVEVRAGTGGEEAALFAGRLMRMYTRYAERQGWRVETMSANPTELGGFKEIIFMIEGAGAYSRLKYESGVHRVQRIPVTESGGRIHTSTATVAVLPEAEEVEIEIHPDELRIDVFRSSGNGGQSVNTTDSSVRLTHIPTGIVIVCQDERSQLKNKEKAMKVLRARLYEKVQAERDAEQAQARKSQVGTGDRSERIRTYNFPQGRVTDHRIGLTLYRLESVLDGDIEELISVLITADQAEKLQQVEAG